MIPPHFLQLNTSNLMSSRTTVPVSSHRHTTWLASPPQTLLEASSFSPDAGCLGPTYSSHSHPAQALGLSCSTVYLVLLKDQALSLLLRSITTGSLELSSSYGFWECSASSPPPFPLASSQGLVSSGCCRPPLLALLVAAPRFPDS